MASAHKYTWQRADGSTGRGWRAKWVDADGRTGSKRGFERQSDALAYAADREAEVRHGMTLAGERPTGKTTVAEWGRTWLAGLELRPSSRSSYGYTLSRIEQTLGGRQLATLRPSELRSWQRGLQERYAPATARQTASMLAMLLRAAVADGLLERSPMPKGRGGRTAGRVLDPAELLTVEQVRAWDAALPEHCRGMAVVAALTGLRQGELLGLRPTRVDFLRREVRVVEQLISPAGAGVPEWGPPKTAAGERTVPLPEPAAGAIAAYLERRPARLDEPIFRTASGGRWRRQRFREVWEPARAAAGLPEWATWHSLRDHTASVLIRGGTDVRTVMAVLGHTSPDETLRTYARIWPDATDRARQAVERLWREAADTAEGQGSTTDG